MSTTDPTELSRFQIDILRVIERESPLHGLGIKAELEDRYDDDDDLGHGRLYPNLNDLVELGLVDKSQRDRRSHNYALTIRGQLFLKERREFLAPEASDETPRETIADGGRQ